MQGKQLTNQKLRAMAKTAVFFVSSTVICSCAPLNSQPSATPRPSGKIKSHASSSLRKSHLAVRSNMLSRPIEASSSVFGIKVPQALSFSRLTRIFSTSDESLDQAPAALPKFPTVISQQAPDPVIDSAVIEDERSLLLLAEADRFAEYSQNKTLTEIARGSLARSLEPTPQTQKAEPAQTPHGVPGILALCVALLIAFGYLVISKLRDDLRARKSPKFGANLSRASSGST